MANSDYYIQDNSNIENTKLEAAKGLYAQGNFAGALKIYLDMINTSYSYKLYYEIGRCYYKLDEIDNAESYFNRSIALENSKNPSYNFLGNIFHKQNKLEKAIENWIKAYSYKPDDETICLNLATSYFSKDMKFLSVFFYEKYLKYAKDKNSALYLDIKQTIAEFNKLGTDFYQKAQHAISMQDEATAIQALEIAAKHYPLNFDTNFLLGKLYFNKKEFLKSSMYLKQAFCIDSKSLDTLELLSNVMINLGNYSGAYCTLKRILPLVMNNQKEYLNILKAIKTIGNNSNKISLEPHIKLAEDYYQNNNYPFALFEYENCLILDINEQAQYTEIVEKLKSFIHPEDRLIKSCFEKGGYSYTNGNYKQSNKYFSKIMVLSQENSPEYKLAKSRIVNV